MTPNKNISKNMRRVSPDRKKQIFKFMYPGATNVKAEIRELAALQGVTQRDVWLDLDTTYVKQLKLNTLRKSLAARRIQTAFLNRPLTPYTASSKMSHAGDIHTSYHFKVQTLEYDDLMAIVRRALKYIPTVETGHYQILAMGLNQQFFGKPFNPTKGLTLSQFNDAFLSHLEKYDDNFTISEIIIKTLLPNPQNGAGCGGRSHITANKIWKIISTKNKTNCLYSAAVQIKIPTTNY